MQNTTTYDSTAEKPVDYELAVEKGLHELDKLLQKIDHNQAETAQMRKETRAIAERIEKLMKEF